MWEIFEVKSNEEAILLINGLELLIVDSNDMREYNDPERIKDRNLCNDLIERLR